jgi:hypothetical protein
MQILPALIIAASVTMHPMHVAYTNIEISQDQKTVTVSHKIYTADLTLLFAHLFEKNIVPSDTTEFKQTEIDLITHYMKYRFNLVAGTDTIQLGFKSKQMDDEHIWLTFNGNLPPGFKGELTINNMLLLDLYMDQKNLVILNNGSIEKAFTFNWDNREEILAL